MQKYAADELNAWTEANGIGVIFGEFSITPIKEGMNAEEIADSVEAFIDMMKVSLSKMSASIKYDQNLTRKTSSYTAKVESMIPAIGWGYINQDFTATVSSSKISNVTIQGYSYDSGFTLGSWEPNRSWHEISNNKQYLQISMKGTINYLWDALNISTPATFLDTFKASGDNLENATYLDWPDGRFNSQGLNHEEYEILFHL